MKNKNTVITAFIALFIVFAGVESVSAEHVINKSETERISKLINGLTKYQKDSYDEDFKKKKIAQINGVFYWGKNGELAWYYPYNEEEFILDPFNVAEYEKIRRYSVPFNTSLDSIVYVAETNRLRGYDSFDKIKKEFDKEKEEKAKKNKAYIEKLKEERRNWSEEKKQKEAEYRDKLIVNPRYVNDKHLKYVGDVLRNDLGVFYWGEAGELAWYDPATGKVADPATTLEGITMVSNITKLNFEAGDQRYADYVAEINKRRGYDSLEKIKEGMKKPKSDTTVKVEEVPAKKSEEPLKKQETELNEKKSDTQKTESNEKKVEENPTTQKQGWVQENGKWFYYVQSNNKQSGWIQVNGAWYYLAHDGEMKTGWLNQGGSWYYLNDSGSMKTGWQKVNGTWYYFNGSGAMQTGWLNQSGTWYYLNSSGSMQTGWLSQSGTWYYLTESGYMKTGWYQVNTKWYYSYSSGALAVSTTVDGYTVNANGEWI
ncbi:hypothetical protein ACTRSF_01940 [Streptococcus pneumoniae]